MVCNQCLFKLQLYKLKYKLFPTAVYTGCTDWEVRLVGGEVETEGRVELCYNGTWWAVSDDNWDIGDAQVVCRHFGFPAKCK